MWAMRIGFRRIGHTAINDDDDGKKWNEIDRMNLNKRLLIAGNESVDPDIYYQDGHPLALSTLK